jgi:hypothetical protein
MTVSEPAANPSVVPECSGAEPINKHERTWEKHKEESFGVTARPKNE